MPLLASLPSTHPWELHVDWLWDRSGSGPAPKNPRVWIAGCGTFQPYAFGVANPHAEIIATDLSEPSLRIAKRRCSVHRQKHVSFAPVDLADESTWPDGQFDLIECYGVLMNLVDPTTALRGLASRLTKRGVLRVMVYPYYSRQRVFQLQRVATLLGLHSNDKSHPSMLRKFVKKLDRSHPLRYAFTTYADSKNDAGVVDGFLHSGDRGFTGFQLGAMIEAAGLTPSFWFQRPWAQPDQMAERLELDGNSQSFVLNYLDLWQELRCNFTVCLRRNDAPAREVQPTRPHPMFCENAGNWRHRLRIERLRWFGGKVPTRTGDSQITLRPQAARAMRDGRVPVDPDHPLVIGGVDHGPALPAHSEFAREDAFLERSKALRIGRRAPNPLYAHIFAALELSTQHPELGLGDVEQQMGRWLPWADPLEQMPTLFGLTPYGTYHRMRVNLQEHMARRELGTADNYESVRLRGDTQALSRVRSLLRANDLPKKHYDDATLRELFVQLFTHDRLFVTLEPA